MYSSTLNKKGQITIPATIRKITGLHPGAKVTFIINNGKLILVHKETNIEAAFGICHPKKSVSLQQINRAIRKQNV